MRVPASMCFFHLTLHSCDYNMYVEGFLPASLCLVTLFNSEPCSQFERFHLQHVQMVNKTSSFKTKLLGYDAKASRIHFTFDVSHSHVLEGRLPVGNHS